MYTNLHDLYQVSVCYLVYILYMMTLQIANTLAPVRYGQSHWQMPGSHLQLDHKVIQVIICTLPYVMQTSTFLLSDGLIDLQSYSLPQLYSLYYFLIIHSANSINDVFVPDLVLLLVYKYNQCNSIHNPITECKLNST